MSTHRPTAAVAGLVGLEAAALSAMGWWPGGRGTPWPALGLWAVAFAAYAIACARSGVSRRDAWLCGIFLRALLLPLAPAFSEDIYRYMWDGWVQGHGINPFSFAPAEGGVEALRTGWWATINHPEIPTIYPPGAQLAFRSLAAIAPAWIVFKLAWIAADLGVAWLIERIAARESRALAPRALILYLWSPLLVVEVAWSGHLEPLGLVPVMAAILLEQRSRLGADTSPRGAGRGVGGRPLAIGTLLGLGAAIKFAPLAAVPALWRRHGLRAAAAAVLLPVVLYAPFASAGARLFEGLGEYADRWAFNAGAFQLLGALIGPDEWARWAVAGIVVAVALGAAWSRWTLARTLLWTTGAALLLSPTLHPWYVLWILPFACLFESRAWLALTGTVFLAYAGRDAYLASGVWPEPAWLRALVHGPVILLLLYEARDLPQRLARGREVAGGEQPGERDGPEDAQLGEVRDRPGE